MQVKATYRNILQIALPVIIGSMAQAILNLIDTAYLGRVDRLTLAAAAIGITLYLVFTLLCMGLSIGIQIIVARRTGEGSPDEVGKVFDQGQYLLFVFGLSLFLIMQLFSPFILNLLVKSEDVRTLALDFIKIRSFGVLAVCFNMVYRSLYIGLSRTRILIYTTSMMAGINIVLDYLFIFGIGPFPVMGIKGAALASVIAEFVAFAYFVLYTRYFTDYRKYNIYSFQKPHKDTIFKIINLSYPTVFQNFVSIAAWFLFFIIIEKTGEDQLAASNAIRSVLMVMMFPMWGFAATANTMVSNLLGQNNSHKIPGLLKKIFYLALCWIFLFGIIILIKPELLLHIITDDAQLIELSKGPLYLLYFALFIIFPSIILLHSLIGTGDTRTAFIIEVTAISMYLLFTYFTAIVFRANLIYIWGAEVIYWVIIAAISFLRLKSRKWKNIRI